MAIAAFTVSMSPKSSDDLCILFCINPSSMPPGDTDWAKAAAKVPNDPAIPKFPADTWKCNLFVADVLYDSGIK